MATTSSRPLDRRATIREARRAVRRARLLHPFVVAALAGLVIAWAGGWLPIPDPAVGAAIVLLAAVRRAGPLSGPSYGELLELLERESAPEPDPIIEALRPDR